MNPVMHSLVLMNPSPDNRKSDRAGRDQLLEGRRSSSFGVSSDLQHATDQIPGFFGDFGTWNTVPTSRLDVVFKNNYSEFLCSRVQCGYLLEDLGAMSILFDHPSHRRRLTLDLLRAF